MGFTRITVDPAQMGGMPCIRGLRILVATVVSMVADAEHHALPKPAPSPRPVPGQSQAQSRSMGRTFARSSCELGRLSLLDHAA